MHRLQDLVNSCGVTFRVTLTQSQNLLVLEKRPDKLHDLVPEDDAPQIAALWKIKIAVGRVESWLAIKDSLTHRPSSQGWASKCLIIYSSLY